MEKSFELVRRVQVQFLLRVAARAGEVVSGFGVIKYMQDITPLICNDVHIDDEGQLIDIRDERRYFVARLRDGNCWMIENLGIVNKTIDSTNSDMTSGSFTIPASNISGFTTSDKSSRKAYLDDTYGGYYNYYTATAGNAASSGEAPNSICPKGWKLPIAFGDKSYNALLLSYGTYQSGTLIYGGQSILAPPLNFVKSGGVNNSSLHYAGSQGYYWTSMSSGSDNAYSLSISTSVNLSAGSGRHWGNSVRCVAR